MDDPALGLYKGANAADDRATLMYPETFMPRAKAPRKVSVIAGMTYWGTRKNMPNRHQIYASETCHK